MADLGWLLAWWAGPDDPGRWITPPAPVVGSFPVRSGDDVMLVTDAGRLIRCPADQVRITGRQVMGVTLFRLGDGERVTSVFPVLEAPPPADALDVLDADPAAHASAPPSDAAGADLIVEDDRDG